MSEEMVNIKIACLFLASGRSKRFGSDKLLYPVDGIPMAERAFSAIPPGIFDYAFAVTRSVKVASLAMRVDIIPLINLDETDDKALTIRLGTETLPDDTEACMFLVCDQPYLSSESIRKLAAAARERPERIHSLSFNGERGNPVVFPRALFDELRNLPPDESGRYVIRRHPELLSLVEAGSARELEDIDVPPGLETAFID